jgi:hypothetical protein
VPHESDQSPLRLPEANFILICLREMNRLTSGNGR